MNWNWYAMKDGKAAGPFAHRAEAISEATDGGDGCVVWCVPDECDPPTTPLTCTVSKNPDGTVDTIYVRRGNEVVVFLEDLGGVLWRLQVGDMQVTLGRVGRVVVEHGK